MSDFPGLALTKGTISTLSHHGIGLQLRAVGGANTTTTSAYPSANLGYYIPIALPAPFKVSTMFWLNGTSVAGNVDVGIYSSNGTLLVSQGPVAQAGTSTVQFFILGTPIRLDPGAYYLALSCSSTSGNFRTSSLTAEAGRIMGLAQQASVGTLPATATFAQFAQTTMPIIGITNALGV